MTEKSTDSSDSQGDVASRSEPAFIPYEEVVTGLAADLGGSFARYIPFKLVRQFGRDGKSIVGTPEIVLDASKLIVKDHRQTGIEPDRFIDDIIAAQRQFAEQGIDPDLIVVDMAVAFQHAQGRRTATSRKSSNLGWDDPVELQRALTLAWAKSMGGGEQISPKWVRLLSKHSVFMNDIQAHAAAMVTLGQIEVKPFDNIMVLYGGTNAGVAYIKAGSLEGENDWIKVSAGEITQAELRGGVLGTNDWVNVRDVVGGRAFGVLAQQLVRDGKLFPVHAVFGSDVLALGPKERDRKIADYLAANNATTVKELLERPTWIEDTIGKVSAADLFTVSTLRFGQEFGSFGSKVAHTALVERAEELAHLLGNTITMAPQDEAITKLVVAGRTLQRPFGDSLKDAVKAIVDKTKGTKRDDDLEAVLIEDTGQKSLYNGPLGAAVLGSLEMLLLSANQLPKVTILK